MKQTPSEQNINLITKSRHKSCSHNVTSSGIVDFISNSWTEYIKYSNFYN